MKKTNLLLLALASTLLWMQSAGAAIISGDFREELSLPYCCGPDTRVLESLGAAIVAGDELTEADETVDVGYSGHANMDLDAAGLLTLTGQEPAGFANYELAVFSISNIAFSAGESIIDVIVIGLGNEIFDGSAPGPLTPTPTVSFTADSVTITYDTGIPEQFNFGQDLTAQFQIVTGEGRAPAPGTLALMALVVAGLGLARRRTRV